uniref:Uncharacterized protein n=1 Tax=Arundo donax TaxID=35708 RepID=A0A0A9E2D6_ARUDO
MDPVHLVSRHRCPQDKYIVTLIEYYKQNASFITKFPSSENQ